MLQDIDVTSTSPEEQAIFKSQSFLNILQQLEKAPNADIFCDSNKLNYASNNLKSQIINQDDNNIERIIKPEDKMLSNILLVIFVLAYSLTYMILSK